MRMGRGYGNKGVVPAMEALFWNWRAWLLQWGVVYAMKAWSRRCMGVACWGRGLAAGGSRCPEGRAAVGERRHRFLEKLG